MIVDTKTYSESVTRSLHTDAPMTVADFIEGESTKSSIFGASLEEYKKAGPTEAGNILASETTYAKPKNEKNAVDQLERDATKSEDQHKNEMAVIASTRSPEDLKQMEDQGFLALDSDSHTIITVTDKIKAVMAQAGDVSMGDLSEEQLEEITGSLAMAQKISHIMDDAKAFLLKNNLEPTIENIYKAQFSGINSRVVHISEDDFAAISTQMQDLIKNANLTVDNESMENAKWLITNGIPVNGDNLSYLKDLNALAEAVEKGQLTGPVLEDMVKRNLVNGSLGKDTMLIEGYSLEDQAKEAMDIVENISDSALAYCLENGRELNLKNLAYAQKQVDEEAVTVTMTDARLATARRQLEEIRLSMTLEANQSLLKKGISIDTEPIEQLLSQLKDVENSYYARLFAAEGIEVTEEKVDVFQKSVNAIEDLKTAPAYFIQKLSAEDTLSLFHVRGQEQKAEFASAKESYESLMTSPRQDLGDSMKKAFRNVDDILEDLNLPKTKENERAVRILAYNQTEITSENIMKVKATDEQVQQAFKNLTPKTTLEMIRQGMNPLEMSMDKLNQTADQIKESIGVEDSEKFSRFLHKLDQKGQISQEERDSYIGIYRLIAQVEKTDGAAIGSLMNQGAEITMKNLLTAVRSSKKSGMDYSVNDSFEGVEVTSKGPRIDDQIMAGYHRQCANDALDALSPDKIRDLSPESILAMSPEELKEALSQMAESMEDLQADKAYYAEEIETLKQAQEASSDIYAYLDKIDAPVTASNVLASMRLLADSNGMLDRIFKKGPSDREKVAAMKDEILDRFGQALESPTELGEAQEALADVATNVMKTMIIEDPDVQSLDVREMKVISAGMKLCANQAKDESYLVPLETTEGICGVAVRIIRDQDKKGRVDITFRGNLSGKVAASFEAKEDRISGMIAVSDQTTRDQFSGQLGLFASIMNERPDEFDQEAIDLQVAYIPDLNLEKFQLHSNLRESVGDKGNQVQTKRLYHVAESFIQTVQELMSEPLF